MTYNKAIQRGKFTPLNPQKYVGDVHNIWYRSGLERSFMLWCDKNPNVMKYASEEIVIPYISPVDGKRHRYFVDFAVQIQTKSGPIRTYLVEIKPSAFIKEPKPPKRKTKRFLQEAAQWRINQAKWAAAKSWCLEKGWSFMVITEKDLRINWK